MRIIGFFISSLKIQEIKKMVDFMLSFDIIAKKVADIIKAF